MCARLIWIGSLLHFHLIRDIRSREKHIMYLIIFVLDCTGISRGCAIPGVVGSEGVSTPITSSY